MSDSNPFSPPQAYVADSSHEFGADIDLLSVSDTWKKRFKWLKKAGGPSMKNLKNMPVAERMDGTIFNILAFFFGPIYYIAKGMWRKGLVLFVVGIAVVVFLKTAIKMAGLGEIRSSLAVGVSMIFAMRANIDYYKKMVLGENGWW